VPTLPEYEAMLRDQLERMGAAKRGELLYTLELTDFERAAAIGDLSASAIDSLTCGATHRRRDGPDGPCAARRHAS
jgi:hypothetical protein